MPYFSPYIDNAGIHYPTYEDIVTELVNQAKTIFGNDIYLENDSQDYQWISIVAKSISDSFNALAISYNQRAPRSAIGVGLDGLVSINGIVRNPATYSTCVLKVSGDSGTVITSGIASDVNGIQWYLPATVTIPVAGFVYVTATCATIGTVIALIGEINAIVTPTAGWSSVDNEVAAVPGANLETDASLRARQSISAALPSSTIKEGIQAAILDLNGVTRSKVYENDTNTTDSNGIPSHSISAVVEGGTSSEIANAIFYKKGPGCGTYGTTTTDVTDAYGSITQISYSVPTYVDVRATVTVKKLTGYTSAYADAIKQSLVDYLTSADIGEKVYNSSLWQAALASLNDISNPAYAVTSVVAAEGAGSQTTADISVAFNKVATGSIVNMVVIET